MIPVLKPSWSPLESANVASVLQSGWWGLGPRCGDFEAELVRRTGYRHAITLNSATAALHLALRVLDCGPGDDVLLPALTFVSTALAISYVGARPVFVDVDPETLCLDWRDVRAKLSARTRAVMAVDYAGYPAGCIALPPGVALVEDAAHNALGRHDGDIVCYSFHPVKQIATGDGGALLTNNDVQAAELCALRWCGIDRSTWERNGRRYNWDYEIHDIGYKLHWNDVQAAIGLAQLARHTEMQRKRMALVAHYSAQLADVPGIQLPADHAAHTWHLYVIRVAPDKRDGLLDYLAARGINAGVHYKPVTHYQPYQRATPPVTEREWRRCVTLPLYVDMTVDEQEQVIAALKTWAREVRC